MVSESTWGVLAATAAPLAMASGFVIWDKRWVGGSGFTLNAYKCALASVGFFIVVSAMGNINADGDGSVTRTNRSLLVLSGFIGIVLGDTAWLIALKRIGAHRTIVVDAIKPFVSALFSLAILGEKLTAVQIVGMIVCLAGVSIVSLERAKPSDAGGGGEIEEKEEDSGRKSGAAVEDVTIDVEKSADKNDSNSMTAPPLWTGYMYSAANVLLDVYGAILTKQNGIAMDTWQVCWLRFGSSGLMLLGILVAARRCKLLVSSSSSSPQWATFPSIGASGYGWISLGVALTTFLCPALQNFAIFKIDLGIFSTLTSLTPLFSLPLCRIIKKEKISNRAIVGTVVAVGGVVILYATE